MLCEYVWLCHTQKRSPNVDHRSIALHAGNQGASDPRSQHAHVRAHTHRHAHTQKHIHTHTCMSVPSRERKSLEASLPEAWKACLCISGRRCVRAWGGQDERKGEHCVVHAFAQVPVLARGAWSDSRQAQREILSYHSENGCAPMAWRQAARVRGRA